MEQRPGPAGTTSEELAKFGLEVMNRWEQRLQCVRCSQVWWVCDCAPPAGYLYSKRPNGYWRCTQGCNAAARPGAGDAAALLKAGVVILNRSGVDLRCRKCGRCWPVFRGKEGVGFPARWWECLAGCNTTAPPGAEETVAPHLERVGLLVPVRDGRAAARSRVPGRRRMTA